MYPHTWGFCISLLEMIATIDKRVNLDVVREQLMTIPDGSLSGILPVCASVAMLSKIRTKPWIRPCFKPPWRQLSANYLQPAGRVSLNN